MPRSSELCPIRSADNIKRTYLASGGSSLQLAEETAAEMGIELGPVQRKQFANSELYVRYEESIRGMHAIILQSPSAHDGKSVNDFVMETLLMIDAAKRASASEISVVLTCMPYARQDRKTRGREPISAAVIINMLQATGADRIVSVDMHSAQTQATFDGPFDHLTAEPLIRYYLQEKITASPLEQFEMVSPDGGRAKNSEAYADQLGIDVFHMPKKRDRLDPSRIVRPERIAEVAGLHCIIVDDIIDTGGTLVSAAETLKNSGATGVTVCATHGLFSGPALERLAAAPIDEVIVTNTVPQQAAQEVLGDTLKIVSIAPVLGRALLEIIMRGSVSEIFGDGNHR